MIYKLLLGQNQWLDTEYFGRDKDELYQVVVSHRCPQVSVGDIIRVTRKGMMVAYSDVDATRPRYRIPSHAEFVHEDRYEEE